MEQQLFVYLSRLVLAAVLGGIIGYERKTEHKEAGVRTHSLVAIGAALFTLVSFYAFSGEGEAQARIMAQVVSGIGFLGAGVIIFHGGHLTGLTTAAGLWVCAAIGMVSGLGWYTLAITSTGLVLFILYLLGRWFPMLQNKAKKDVD